MDTVYSNKDDGSACLLVLTERKTRDEISVKMPSRTAAETVKALDKIEKAFDRHQKGLFHLVFKTITCDNGSEFSDIRGMIRSRYKNRGPRTRLFFCHPFCSYERGSNENNNKLIRRFIPKGAKISDYTHEDIARIIKWTNNYPRGIFGGYTSNDLFMEEVKKLIA